MLAHLIFTLQHRADVRPYTSSYDLAESCVFIKQSPLPISCHFNINFYKLKKIYIEILLIPKLQSQFAEFLQHNSLKHLSLLNLFTCVSFSTVNIKHNFFFLKIYPILNKIYNI